MDVHIQRCQNCGSTTTRNILARDDAQRVYVQCRSCGELVARYILAQGGYYHNGKDYESFLRTLMLDGGFSSGRDMQALFEEVKAHSAKGFEKACEEVRKKYGENPPN